MKHEQLPIIESAIQYGRCARLAILGEANELTRREILEETFDYLSLKVAMAMLNQGGDLVQLTQRFEAGYPNTERYLKYRNASARESASVVCSMLGLYLEDPDDSLRFFAKKYQLVNLVRSVESGQAVLASPLTTGAVLAAGFLEIQKYHRRNDFVGVAVATVVEKGFFKGSYGVNACIGEKRPMQHDFFVIDDVMGGQAKAVAEFISKGHKGQVYLGRN